MNHAGTESPIGAPPPKSRFVWRDEWTGAAVSVNGGLVEIDHGAAAPYLLTPDEAAAFTDALANAVVHACAWAARWNPATRSYSGASV